MTQAASGDGLHARVRRLRWRLRGAWLWPTFGIATVADAILLHHLPIAGNGGTGWVPAFLLAGCLNVVAIAALGGLGGWLLRRRRPDLPKVVADDRAGTALVLAVSTMLLVFGLVHRPALRDYEADLAAQAVAARNWFAAQAPPAYRAHADATDTLRVAPELYRTCAPGGDPDRWLCIYLDTSDRPVTVRRDTSGASNARFDPSGGFR
ncbi:MAG: hypothetical protein QOG77_2792 [Solirubrobacteraceae bacterium]|jgi:hypothetical protein|nr:hypothetical protein [Solirubrobacteraceae bacterium]